MNGSVRRGCATAVAVATAAVCGAVSPSPPAPRSPAEALFGAARDARSRAAYPHYARYATVVRYRIGAQPVTRTWETVEDIRRRLVFAHAFSREETAAPTTPHGINLALRLSASAPAPAAFGAIPNPDGPRTASFEKRLSSERAGDPLGQVTFAVDQDFGLARGAPPVAATRDLAAMAATASALPRIGGTGGTVRTYEITDAGDVDEAGTALHHLVLRPLREARRNRLRELWIDAATSAPVRAVVAGVGNRAPLNAVDWRVDFAGLDGGVYVARETALAPLRMRHATLSGATIAFEDFRPAGVLAATETLGIASGTGFTDE